MIDAAIIVPDWPAPANVHAVVTTRRMPGRSRPPFDAMNLGARCGDAPGAVAENRDLLIDLLGLPAAPRWLRQVHGTRVFAADGEGGEGASKNGSERREFARRRSAGTGVYTSVHEDSEHRRRTNYRAQQVFRGILEPEADAAVTHTPGSVLAILSADCLPVLLCSDDGHAIGVAHAGWRGLAAGVIEAAVERLYAPAEHLLAWLGPAIGPASYEVGDEVRAAFVARHAHAAAAFSATRAGHWRCDLYALARLRLAAAGVGRVYGGALDTCTNARFYSYRRDHETGRFAALIWMA
jgi:YfiH family protein